MQKPLISQGFLWWLEVELNYRKPAGRYAVQRLFKPLEMQKPLISQGFLWWLEVELNYRSQPHACGICAECVGKFGESLRGNAETAQRSHFRELVGESLVFPTLPALQGVLTAFPPLPEGGAGGGGGGLRLHDTTLQRGVYWGRVELGNSH